MVADDREVPDSGTRPRGHAGHRRKAGAVDGVTARNEATVDGFPAEIHGALIDELRRIAWG